MDLNDNFINGYVTQIHIDLCFLCIYKWGDSSVSRGKLQNDLHQEIKKKLRAKECFGQSRYKAKQDGMVKDGIFSYQTAKIYNRECQKFARYVCKMSPAGRFTALEDALSYAKDYIAMENASGKSPYTVKLERSALSKLFGVDAKELGEVRLRARKDIKRSRIRTVISSKTGKEIKNQSSLAGHFSEKNHKDEVLFAKSTGMRRSEMQKVRGDQFFRQKDGSYCFRMDSYQCKGGRARIIPIIADHKEIARIKELCEAAGHDKVWDKVPVKMDVHHYRSCYATNYYNLLARDRDNIPQQDRYCCRKDRAGVWFDKLAMLQVSEALGHSRISVIAGYYLR